MDAATSTLSASTAPFFPSAAARATYNPQIKESAVRAIALASKLSTTSQASPFLPSEVDESRFRVQTDARYKELATQCLSAGSTRNNTSPGGWRVWIAK